MPCLNVGDGMHALLCLLTLIDLWYDPSLCICLFNVHDEILVSQFLFWTSFNGTGTTCFSWLTNFLDYVVSEMCFFPTWDIRGISDVFNLHLTTWHADALFSEPFFYRCKKLRVTCVKRIWRFDIRIVFQLATYKFLQAYKEEDFNIWYVIWHIYQPML